MIFIQGAPGMQQISILNTVKVLTVPAGAIGALIQPVAQNVYMSTNGVAPSATNGMNLTAGQIYEFPLGTVDALSQLKFIEVTPSAMLNVAYF